MIANQTIYHDKDYPSMIELPIIPLKRKRNYINWPFKGEDSMNMQDIRKWNQENRPSPLKEFEGSQLEKHWKEENKK